PNNPAVLANLGVIVGQRGDHQAAIDAFSKIINARPVPSKQTLGQAFMQRAEAYRSLAEYNKALADTDAALKTGYQEPNLRLVRANIFFQNGKRDDAGREADLLLQENPLSDFAFIAAGKIYAAVGRRTEAVKALN